MKLLMYTSPSDDAPKLGIMTDRGVIDVAAATAQHGADAIVDMYDAIYAERPELEGATADAETFLSAAEITYLPCVTAPEKIICVGLNYKKHAEEAGAKLPETPILFSKFNNALAAHGEEIPLPANAEQYDYEVELGVVIGREGRYISEENALDYVFGYCTINDLSVRELQMRTSQWLLGKTIDKGLPIGPYLVTADEVDDPHDLNLKTWVNGELRQNSNTNDLVFNINQIISYASQYFTLKPGDVIATGTPEGVILGMNPRVWLKPGDEVTVEIEGLGACSNRFVAG